MTAEIRHLLNLKTKLWKCYSRSGTDTDYDNYTHVANSVRKKIRYARFNFDFRMIKDDRSKKNLFRHIRNLRGKSSPVVIRTDDGINISLPVEIASLFSYKFCDASGQASDNEDPPDFSNYEFPTNQFVIDEEKLWEQEIAAAINCVRTSCACGPDGVSPIVVKRCANAILYPLTKIFISSVYNGIFPADLKCANVIPIHKKGSLLSVDNYRPISLLSIFAKIFETVIDKWLKSETQILLRNSAQHGFRPGHSVETNLVTSKQYINKAIEMKGQVDAIYVDISKAFDTVPHTVLVSRLANIGVNPLLVRWIADYLGNRSQSVFVNNCSSGPTSMKRGIPQGSILGPTLFNIFLSEIETCTEHSSLLLYADDIKIFNRVDIEDGSSKLQSDFDRIVCWLNLNYMTISEDKTTCMSFYDGVGTTNQYFYLHNIKIRNCLVTKDLGVVFDPLLRFTEHANLIIKRLTALYFNLRYNLYFWSPQITALVIRTYVRPILEFCSSIWNSCPSRFKTFENKLNKTLNKFTKLQRVGQRILLSRKSYVTEYAKQFGGKKNYYCLARRLILNMCKAESDMSRNAPKNGPQSRGYDFSAFQRRIEFPKNCGPVKQSMHSHFSKNCM